MIAAHRCRAPMAVRAADFAFADLLSDRGETAPVPRELRHGRALESDVVELEDDRIAFIAVGARMPAQDLDEIGQVPCDVRIHVWPCRRARHGTPSPASASGGPSPMAVRTHDLAL